MAAMVAPITARIIGIEAPTNISPGTPFTVSIMTENYIQSVTDLAVAWGINPGKGFASSIGNILGTKLLLSDSNTLDSIPFTLTAPDYLAEGQATVSASVTSLYGASKNPVTYIFNVTVSVGADIQSQRVKSRGWYASDGFSWVG